MDARSNLPLRAKSSELMISKNQSKNRTLFCATRLALLHYKFKNSAHGFYTWLCVCVSPPKHDITSHTNLQQKRRNHFKLRLMFYCIVFSLINYKTRHPFILAASSTNSFSMAGSDWISRVPWNHPSELGYFFFCSSEISISHIICLPSCLNSGIHSFKNQGPWLFTIRLKLIQATIIYTVSLKMNIDLVIYVTKQNFLIYIWLLLNNNNYKWLITDFKQNWKTTKNYLYQIDWLLQKHINFCTCNCDHMKYSKLTS